MRIAVIPIDNRPICYDLIKDILSINRNIELFMPEIKYLGGLNSISNIDEIFNFINSLNDIDYLIVSLDTIAYGGLISSRRCEDSFFDIENRIIKFRELASKKAKKILAFSSIMRISNNNINEEEKSYWAQWGKRIFDWSYYLHKSESEKSFNCVHNIIPSDILEDYLETRKRNFKINKIYLDWAEDNFFDTLILSKDDCAEYGLNVKEANLLQEKINSDNIKNALIKTGADEIPLSLISRVLNYEFLGNLKIKPIFIEKDSIDLISKYEDISIKNCVTSQIELANIKIVNEDADLIMLINNFKDEQGDLVLGHRINVLKKEINFPQDNYFIADVNNANGADNNLIEQLFNYGFNNLYGYCGYNTSANTIGCTILEATTKLIAIKNNSYNENAYKKLMLIRLLDDWAYQTILRKDFSKSKLNEMAKRICKILDYDVAEIKYSFPWNRSFEIRLEVIE